MFPLWYLLLLLGIFVGPIALVASLQARAAKKRWQAEMDRIRHQLALRESAKIQDIPE